MLPVKLEQAMQTAMAVIPGMVRGDVDRALRILIPAILDEADARAAQRITQAASPVTPPVGPNA